MNILLLRLIKFIKLPRLLFSFLDSLYHWKHCLTILIGHRCVIAGQVHMQLLEKIE